MLLEAIRIDLAAIYPLGAAVQLTRVSREEILRAIKSRDLAATKRGRQWLIAGCDLQRWLAPGADSTD